jgi:hypothetical protein
MGRNTTFLVHPGPSTQGKVLGTLPALTKPLKTGVQHLKRSLRSAKEQIGLQFGCRPETSYVATSTAALPCS